ncbi:MAG: ASKHA domain-containing protein, partial [Bacteroidota bacterium]
FKNDRGLKESDFTRIAIAGNTTMLHLLLGVDPKSIALAPFTPEFTDKQVIRGEETDLNINNNARLTTIPCISAYVGADIVAGLAVLKSPYKNYLFLDIGTNGEMALVSGDKIFTCATAAGPAFEGANLVCGMGAVQGAVSVFDSPDEYGVIGNIPPTGICGSGIVDIIAYLIENGFLDEEGLLPEDFHIHQADNIYISQQDIREIQLAKSAIYSGIKILLKKAGLEFNSVEALFLAGGFGNYINTESAVKIGLLPLEMKKRIHSIGNSAGIGALQYLKSGEFAKRTEHILARTEYIELSGDDDFTLEFAMNMNFTKLV